MFKRNYKSFKTTRLHLEWNLFVSSSSIANFRGLICYDTLLFVLFVILPVVILSVRMLDNICMEETRMMSIDQDLVFFLLTFIFPQGFYYLHECSVNYNTITMMKLVVNMTVIMIFFNIRFSYQILPWNLKK